MRGNMANELQKCPMCGTKLKLINGRMTCKSCGYYVRNPQEQAQQSNFPYNTSQPSGAAPKKKPAGIIALVVSLCVGVCILLAVVMTFVVGSTEDLVNERLSEAYNSVNRSQSSTRPSVGTNSSGNTPASSSRSATPEPTAPSATRRLPQSSFFIQLAEAIWEKGYRVITAEEYASLTALRIDTDEKTISYQLNYGDTQTLTFESYTDKKLSDLTSFSGLEYLFISDDLSHGDLDGLVNLYAIYAENSIEELVDIIPKPENILELGVESSFFEKNLYGLEFFPNVQYLSVEYDDLENISTLSQFPDLLGLTLKGCDNLTDYSPLMSLTKLKELEIESSQLKTIDFIKVMPDLTLLSVKDSQIPSLDALSSCPELTSLSLTDNYYIKDDNYSIVGELEKLQQLTISLGHNFNLPSFEKLTQLQQLTLKNAEDPAPLKHAVNVTNLHLIDCSWWDLEVLTSMEMLTVLRLQDSHLDSLEPLTRLQFLQALDLEDTNVYGNIEAIFGIPNLYYLNLSECQVGMNFDQIPTSETLQILYLDKLAIMEDPSFGSNDRTQIDLSAHYDLFDHFPNLTDLNMASLNIDNITFVEKLPHLQYLDISNNNVTSLKPLETLSDFRIVWCGKNTILENVSEDSGILVITSN